MKKYRASDLQNPWIEVRNVGVDEPVEKTECRCIVAGNTVDDCPIHGTESEWKPKKHKVKLNGWPICCNELASIIIELGKPPYKYCPFCNAEIGKTESEEKPKCRHSSFFGYECTKCGIRIGRPHKPSDQDQPAEPTEHGAMCLCLGKKPGENICEKCRKRWNLEPKPEPIQDELEEKEFYELMQAYRHTPFTEFKGTKIAFESVKTYIRGLLASQRTLIAEKIREAKIKNHPKDCAIYIHPITGMNVCGCGLEKQNQALDSLAEWVEKGGKE